MRAIGKRLAKLEGNTRGVTRVVVACNSKWSDARGDQDAEALALSAGAKPPFQIICVIQSFGEGGPPWACLASIEGPCVAWRVADDQWLPPEIRDND